MSKLKPLVSDGILNKQSKDKQIALLKADRNAILAMYNVDEQLMGGVIRGGIMAQGVAQIAAIIKEKDIEPCESSILCDLKVAKDDLDKYLTMNLRVKDSGAIDPEKLVYAELCYYMEFESEIKKIIERHK